MASWLSYTSMKCPVLSGKVPCADVYYCSTVDDLQSGVFDVHCRSQSATVSPPVDVLSSADDCHVQVCRQQESAENQLSYVHGQ